MGYTVVVHTDYAKEENIESALDVISTIVSKALQRQVNESDKEDT